MSGGTSSGFSASRTRSRSRPARHGNSCFAKAASFLWRVDLFSGGLGRRAAARSGWTTGKLPLLFQAFLRTIFVGWRPIPFRRFRTPTHMLGSENRAIPRKTTPQPISEREKFRAPNRSVAIANLKTCSSARIEGWSFRSTEIDIEPCSPRMSVFRDGFGRLGFRNRQACFALLARRITSKPTRCHCRQTLHR